MKNQVTVLYYTSNREDEKFETRIRKNLLKNCGDLPIVSVSQKPIDLGRNICVGVHENSYTSEFMQIRLGLEAIKTPFVLTAEADFLYPPEYFQFKPTEKGVCYRYYGVWILHAFTNNPQFFFKGYSDGCQLVDRLYWLDLINKGLPDRNDWSQEYKVRCQPSDKAILRTWTSDNPAISFKTNRGVRPLTQLIKKIPPVDRLPYWGNYQSLEKKYLS
ncbi:MAG: hypothetical protein UW23_C0034G0002 [Candidatus Collierbacteria bacterium GW2011_GWA1_44_12]|uniref:Glycosyltransferase n=2 Tax=Candidatus Collieribacteriota TaxID=1752725 RepID=A0A0G1GJQ2_9BACT|nr:MAG: hypothetical protein UW23_C0034G0002 [Candidatus Collierbacteria bacterium GW2011_GWA1_44_12]